MKGEREGGEGGRERRREAQKREEWREGEGGKEGGREREGRKEGDPPFENTHCILSSLANPNIGSIRAITFFNKGTTSPTNGGHNNQSCTRTHYTHTNTNAGRG